MQTRANGNTGSRGCCLGEKPGILSMEGVLRRASHGLKQAARCASRMPREKWRTTQETRFVAPSA